MVNNCTDIFTHIMKKYKEKYKKRTDVSYYHHLPLESGLHTFRKLKPLSNKNNKLSMIQLN